MKKRKTEFTIYVVYLFLLLIAIVYILYYIPESYESTEVSSITRTLEKDGFCVLYNPQYLEEANTNDASTHTNILNQQLQKDVLGRLPPHYVFLDYVYQIKNVSLSTFHRDVTSSKHIHSTQHPVFTLILYKYDGELLSLCPNSHSTYPFVYSRIVNISGKRGTAFLFDSDVLHAGRLNGCKYRDVIQYKLCHREDLPKLNTLNNVKVVKDEKCVISPHTFVLRKLSYFLEMPINTIAYPLMIKREKEDGWIGWIQSWIPIQYYNNPY